MGKIFAIGDIHGCLGMLTSLFNKLPIDQKDDLIVFLGDYIDRGTDSKGVIDFILRLREAGFRMVCLAGNHEVMFKNYLSHKNEALFLLNGGCETLAGYPGTGWADKRKSIPAAHREFINSLVYYHETEDYIFVHAGLRDGIPLARQSEDDLVWIRTEFYLSQYDFGKDVIFGHTPFDQPFVRFRRIGIDTGAVYGNKLTCLVLPEMVYYQV
ncbi:MAG: serine/threonine protein phosphatase [Deltaproteobacteria bacterium]|nr:serine/threonine protein phosphatase [Deltaproteobacteria bacterium]